MVTDVIPLSFPKCGIYECWRSPYLGSVDETFTHRLSETGEISYGPLPGRPGKEIETMITLETTDNSTMVLAEERRRFPRVAVALQIEVRLEGTDMPLRSQTTDISMGGCYVEMPLTLEIKSQVDMLFWLGGQKVSAQGVVVTCHPQFGNGIEFTSMSLEGQSRLRHYLDSLAEQPDSTALAVELLAGQPSSPAGNRFENQYLTIAVQAGWTA